MSDVKGCVYINGDYFSIEDAKLSVFDKTILGVNAFDATSVVKGYIFKLDAHTDRFYRSLKAVRIKPRLSKDELKEVIFETVRRSGLKDGGGTLESLVIVHMIGTGGIPPFGELEAPVSKTTLIVEVFKEEQRPYYYPAEKTYGEGIKVRITSTRNIPLQCLDGRVKQFNRLHHYLATIEARDAGADEALMLDINGNVSEGTYCNIWAVQKGELFTPGPAGLLHGITRATVFEIAEKEGIKTTETMLSPYDLYNADEVFFSTTAGGIMPITEVDKIVVADGKVGPIAKRIFKIYREMHVDPRYATLVPEK